MEAILFPLLKKKHASVVALLSGEWVGGWVSDVIGWWMLNEMTADWDKHWMVRLSCSTVYVSALGRMFFGERH